MVIEETVNRILRVGDEEIDRLIAAGWRDTARSFAAELRAENIDLDTLLKLIDRVSPVTVRELLATDAPAILGLDRETEGDYAGGVATAHTPLDTQTSVPTLEHPGFGAFSPDGKLVGMTFAVIAEDRAETDFTVVAKQWRGQGIATAIKAAAIAELAERGVVAFRTGGAMDNSAIKAANSVLGYVIDEEWVTLTKR